MLPIPVMARFIGKNPGVVTLSGGTFSTTVGSGAARVVLYINQDGTTDAKEDGSQNQVNAATDWIIPNGAARPIYEVRYTNFTGDALAGATTLSADTWAAIDQDHEIHLVRTVVEGIGTDSCTFDLEIRLNGGSTLASAEYTLNATKNP